MILSDTLLVKTISNLMETRTGPVSKNAPGTCTTVAQSTVFLFLMASGLGVHGKGTGAFRPYHYNQSIHRYTWPKFTDMSRKYLRGGGGLPTPIYL